MSDTARKRFIGDIVVAALSSVATTVPIAGIAVYLHHVEIVARIDIERSRQNDEAQLAKQRLGIAKRQAVCVGALGMLEDQRAMSALPDNEAKLLLTNLRQMVSSCIESYPTSGATPTKTDLDAGSIGLTSASLIFVLFTTIYALAVFAAVLAYRRVRQHNEQLLGRVDRLERARAEAAQAGASSRTRTDRSDSSVRRGLPDALAESDTAA